MPVDVTFPGNLGQVETIADLRDIPSTFVDPDTLYVVRAAGRIYSFNPGSLAIDNGTTVIKPDDRTVLQAGRYEFVVNGFASGADGPAGPQGPRGPIDSNSQLALSALPHLALAVRNRAYTTTPIKIAGIGSSNMLNEDGGLAGLGNSPVEVALRTLKAAYDPRGECIWQFANFGENGTGYSGWNVALNGKPKSPIQYVTEYGADVLVVCYGTNDYSPELFHAGQTRGLVSPLCQSIYAYCDSIGIDVINMVPPCPHVGKSKQTRTDPVTGLPVQGRALDNSIPLQYPNRAFQQGQSAGPGDPGNLSVTFTNGNRITAAAGTFNDPSLYAGAIIRIQSPTLGAVANGGYYRIASISTDKSQIVVDNQMDVQPYSYTTGPAAAFTTTGPTNVTIWRVAFDPFTELTPSFTEAFGTITVDGEPVEVITREQIISQDVRQATASSPYNAVLLDVMYDYLRAVQANGEDRYYATGEIVHWNATCVAEVIEPAFAKLAQSLVSAPAGVVSHKPPFTVESVVRPAGSPLQSEADLRIGRAIDHQMKAGESAVIRAPAGHLHTEYLPGGSRIDHLTPGGLPWQKSAIEVVEANVSTANGLSVAIPVGHYAKGDIFGKQQGVGIQNRRITVWNDNGAIGFQAYDDLSSSSEVYTLNAQEGGFKITVLGENTLIALELKLRPFTYGSFQY